MIRDYLETDQLPCAEILTCAMTHAFHWTTVKPVSPDAFDQLTEGEIIRVSEQAGIVSGFSSVWAEDCFLHHLYIMPDMHRRGIGRALMEDALGRHDGQLSLKCQVRNDLARAFYRAMGFVETDEPGGEDDSFGAWIWLRTPAAIAARTKDDGTAT